MRKWLTHGVVAAALILIVLLVVVHQMHPPGIWMGEQLPPGRVQPQLVNAGDTAVLLAPDGSLWAWGGTETSLTNILPRPAMSQVPLRVGSEDDWIQIACGAEHTMALKNDGSLWDWGENDQGEVGQSNLKHHYSPPTRIGTETNWTQICSSLSHSLALKSDGSLWAWGVNNFGQLGDGTTNNESAPTMIGQDRDWRTIAACYWNGFAIKSNGTLWGWGFYNSSSGLQTNVLTPKQIALGTKWLSISATGNSMLALRTDGTLWLGAFELPFGFYSVPPGSLAQIGSDNDWTGVYAGANSIFARKKNGGWWVCGHNDRGQLGLGTHSVSVTYLSETLALLDALPSPQRLPFDFDPWAFGPGGQAAVLLRKDGKLWTWGVRMGAGKPGAVRQKFEAFVAPAVKRFPWLGFLIKSDIDRTPHLLWELPPEVRRALGTGPKSSTNNLTAGSPAHASLE